MSISRKRALLPHAASAFLIGAVGCVAPPPEEAPPPTATDDDDDDDIELSPDEAITLGAEVVCGSPSAGMNRFLPQAVERGIDRPLSDTAAIDEFLAYGHGGSTIAQDLDADGDIDLIFGRLDGPPDAYVNDGAGHFEHVDLGIEFPPGRRYETTSISAVDLDGDRLPEILTGNGGWFLLFRPVAPLSYGEAEQVHLEEETPRMDLLTHAWGDPDGDNDLDLLLPSTSMTRGEGDPELIITQNDGVLDEITQLDNGVGTTTLVGLFTDVDGDHDQDVFIPSDLGPPSTLWVNDADGFTERAPELGTDIVMAAMGVDAADLNGDGLLDYCMTDVGPPRCLQSHASGMYLEPGPGLGLTPSAWVETAGTVGWSIEFADLDADGNLDWRSPPAPSPKRRPASTSSTGRTCSGAGTTTARSPTRRRRRSSATCATTSASSPRTSTATASSTS